MNDFSEGYADYIDDYNEDYFKGYIAGINRAINKLVKLGKIDVTEAAELSAACLSPDPEPDPFDTSKLFR